MRSAKRLSVALLALALASTTPVWGKVTVSRAADGTKVILGEPAEVRSVRLAPRLFSVPDPAVSSMIERHARANGLPARLVQAVMQVESGYNPRALSNKGAMGLMQLMPGTAKDLLVDDPWDAEQNIRAGVAYLKALVDRFKGRLDHALAGYNAGPEAVVRHAGIPPYKETRDYVRKVLHLTEGREPGLSGGRVVVRRDPLLGVVISGVNVAAPLAPPVSATKPPLLVVQR